MTAQDQARATAARIKAESEADKTAKEEAKKSPKVVNTKEEAAEAVEELKAKKAEKSDVAVVEKEPEQPQESAIEPAREENGQLIMTPKHIELIKTQIAKNATPEEFDLFMMMVRRTRLDPLLKQLYFFKYKNRKASEKAGCKCWGECTCGKAVYNSATYVTSIDGLRIIAHRTGMFDGVDEPEYKYANNNLYSCTIKVYKKGSSHAFAATVKFSEYTTGKDLWAKMPETMIAKVAEAHALRKAFPQDLSGIYTTDEMDQANNDQNSGTKQLPAKARPKMVTKQQVADLKILMQGKQVGKERLKSFVEKAFGVDSIVKLTEVQMETVLKKLDSLPTPSDPLLDDDEPEEIFSAEEPVQQSDEAVEIDLDEVDAGIERMRAEGK